MRVWYAQLLLLFTYKVGEAAVSRQALVRWYEDAPQASDQLVEAGCTRLKWAEGRAGQPWLAVIDIESVICRSYIVPDFAADKIGGEFAFFYASVFKWDRTVPSNRPIPHP